MNHVIKFRNLYELYEEMLIWHQISVYRPNEYEGTGVYIKYFKIEKFKQTEKHSNPVIIPINSPKLFIQVITAIDSMISTLQKEADFLKIEGISVFSKVKKEIVEKDLKEEQNPERKSRWSMTDVDHKLLDNLFGSK